MTDPVALRVASSSQTNESSRVSRREGWLAAALLFVLMTAVHYDIIFLGRSLVLTNHSNPLDYRPLPQNYGEDMVPPEEWTRRNLLPYANIRDPGGTWWLWDPSGEFLHRAMELGEWPFWDPYAGGGAPAMADLTSAFFFPPYSAMVALGASVLLKNAYFLLLLWAASFFTFLFLRMHGLAFLSSSCGAAIVLMSGALNQHLGTLMGQTAACLPFALYVTRLFLDVPNRRRTAGLAVTYAAISLASFPPVLLGVFGLATLYTLVALTFGSDDARTRARSAVRWVGAVLLSLGLVGWYYVPAASLWSTSAPHIQAVYDGAGLEAIPLGQGYQLLSPTLMGGVQVYLKPAVPMPLGPHIPYVGMVALLAAALAHFGASHRTRVLFLFSLVGVITILLKLFGVRPVQWVGFLPVLGRIHFAHYFGIPVGFLVAFMAALGVENILRGAMSAWRAIAIACLGVIAVESLWQTADQIGVLRSDAAAYWVRDWKFLGTVTVLSAAAILLATFFRPRAAAGRPAATVLLVLLAAEGVFNNSYPNPDAWDMFDHPVPFIKLLQQKAGFQRLMPFGAPNANLNSAFEVFSMDSLMAFNPPRAFQLYQRYTDAPPWLFMREAKKIPPDRVLDRANVAFLGIRDAFPDIVRAAQSRGYRLLFDDGYVSLFERHTLPRFFFSTEYRVVATTVALDVIAQAPPREIVLEQSPGFPSTPNGQDSPDVQIQAYRRNSVTLAVNAPRAGLVYASENFFDGWTAIVNGAPTPILPANYAYRAVAIPPGPVRIEFRYWPPGLTLGLMISGVSAGVLPVLVRPKRRTRRLAAPIA